MGIDVQFAIVIPVPAREMPLSQSMAAYKVDTPAVQNNMVVQVTGGSW